MASKSGKRWYRTRNLLAATGAVILAITAWVVYEVAAVLRAKPNPSVNYAAQFRALSEGYVRDDWDANRAEEAWRLLNEASDLAAEVMREEEKRVQTNPERYPERFEDDRLLGLRYGFHYVISGPELPADIDREREALAALRERGVFDLLDRFAAFSPAFAPLEVGDLYPAVQNIGGYRELARVHAAMMRIAAEEENAEEVLRCLDRTLAIAQSMSHYPSVVWHLGGLSVRSIASQQLCMLLMERSFEPSWYRAAIDVLERRDLPSFRLALEGERLVWMDVIQSAFSDEGKGNGYVLDPAVWTEMARRDELAAQTKPMSVRFAFLSRFVLPNRREFTSVFHDYFDLARDELDRTPADWIEHQPTPLETYVDALPERYLLLKLLSPAFEKAMRNDRVSKMFYDAARVMVALELHRAEQGRYPSSLDELASMYLSHPPVDPIHGGPFGYRLIDGDPHGRPYLLYSFGLDRTDDDGEQLLGYSEMPDPDARWETILRPRFGTGYDFILNSPRESWPME